MTAIRFISVIFLLLILFIYNIYAQGLTIQEIQHNLIYNPPTLGNETLREQTILDLDDILEVSGLWNMPPEIEQFYTNMIEKVKAELKQTIDGTSIWMMYNHGFIVKTNQTTFAIDLVNGYNGWFTFVFPHDIIDQIRVLMITHSHSDHYDGYIKMEVLFNDGYVLQPGGPFAYPRNIGMMPGDSITIDGLKIKAHDGLHSVPVRIYEIVTSDSTKYMHTGDNQTSAALPQVSGIDYLFLNCWVNESGFTSPVTGMRNCINLLRPSYMIPGHMQELGHDPARRIGNYHDAYTVDDIPIPSKVQVMAWGERLILNDRYKSFYVYNNSIDKIYLKPNQDSLLIKSKIYNPQNRNLNVTASITSFDSTFQDSIIMYDDGNHHDSLAHDGIYANYIKPVNTENIFHVNAYATDLDSGLYFYMDDFAIFTSAGPVVFDSYSIQSPDTIPNPGDRLKFNLTLRNIGHNATVENISSSLVSLDTCATVIGIQKPKYGHIAAGAIAAGDINQYIKFSDHCAGSHAVDLVLKIYSNDQTFWKDDTFSINIVTGWESIKGNLPESFTLKQNYPNPFNPKTNIQFSIPKSEFVTLKVYNILGQEVAILVSEKLSAGKYKYDWDADRLSSGVYLYKIQSGNYIGTRKMILLR